MGTWRESPVRKRGIVNLSTGKYKIEQRILAVNRAVVSTFDDYRWQELGILMDCIGLIENHSRLLRSLRWGDDDYEGHSLRMLRQIVDNDEPKLLKIEEFVGVHKWLAEEDPECWKAVYGDNQTIELESIEEIGERLDILELNRHAGRIRRGIQNDAEQAIGSAKELVETVLKSIVGVEGERANQDMTALVKDARRELGLDGDQSLVGKPGEETIRRTLSNLGQIVQGLAEVRNLYGTGHGRYKSKALDEAHARLMVNSSITLATFFLEISDAKSTENPEENCEDEPESDPLPW